MAWEDKAKAGTWMYGSAPSDLGRIYKAGKLDDPGTWQSKRQWYGAQNQSQINDQTYIDLYGSNYYTPDEGAGFKAFWMGDATPKHWWQGNSPVYEEDPWHFKSGTGASQRGYQIFSPRGKWLGRTGQHSSLAQEFKERAEHYLGPTKTGGFKKDMEDWTDRKKRLQGLSSWKPGTVSELTDDQATALIGTEFRPQKVTSGYHDANWAEGVGGYEKSGLNVESQKAKRDAALGTLDEDEITPILQGATEWGAMSPGDEGYGDWGAFGQAVAAGDYTTGGPETLGSVFTNWLTQAGQAQSGLHTAQTNVDTAQEALDTMENITIPEFLEQRRLADQAIIRGDEDLAKLRGGLTLPMSEARSSLLQKAQEKIAKDYASGFEGRGRDAQAESAQRSLITGAKEEQADIRTDIQRGVEDLESQETARLLMDPVWQNMMSQFGWDEEANAPTNEGSLYDDLAAAESQLGIAQSGLGGLENLLRSGFTDAQATYGKTEDALTDDWYDDWWHDIWTQFDQRRQG